MNSKTFMHLAGALAFAMVAVACGMGASSSPPASGSLANVHVQVFKLTGVPTDAVHTDAINTGHTGVVTDAVAPTGNPLGTVSSWLCIKSNQWEPCAQYGASAVLMYTAVDDYPVVYLTATGNTSDIFQMGGALFYQSNDCSGVAFLGGQNIGLNTSTQGLVFRDTQGGNESDASTYLMLTKGTPFSTIDSESFKEPLDGTCVVQSQPGLQVFATAPNTTSSPNAPVGPVGVN